MTNLESQRATLAAIIMECPNYKIYADTVARKYGCFTGAGWYTVVWRPLTEAGYVSCQNESGGWRVTEAGREFLCAES